MAVLSALVLWWGCDRAGWTRPPVSDIFLVYWWVELTFLYSAGAYLAVRRGLAAPVAVAATGGLASCADAAPTEAHANPQGFYSNQMTVKDFERLPDPRPRLRAVHVPSLIMRGDCDFIRPAVTQEYRQTLPDSRIVHIKDAGHAISHSRPALYTALLRSFLLDRPLPAPAS
ncbi:alpha/beta fold hydrolase [Streptomyces sp. NBC_00448]|uniref:alpha/beta fold hydrolase n=1 Tax=Streptomyces sp. NBC_00448 TaxID=2903652 RepID=UPI002E1A1259